MTEKEFLKRRKWCKARQSCVPFVGGLVFGLLMWGVILINF